MKEGSLFKAVFVVLAWKVHKDLVHEGIKLFQCNTCKCSFLQRYSIKGCIPRTIQFSAEICKIYFGVDPDFQQTKKCPCIFDSSLQRSWAKCCDKYPVFGNSFLWYWCFSAFIPRFEFAVQRLLWFVYSESYVMLSVIVYVYWAGFKRVKLGALREVWPDRWWY